MTADDRAYAAQLGDVLRQRDIWALRAFLEAQAGRYGDERQVEAIRAQSDAELEVLLHRMTLARNDLQDLHGESGRWLAARLGGEPTPTDGPRRPGPRQGGGPRRRKPPQS
jgi:hypothetical protein